MVGTSWSQVNSDILLHWRLEGITWDDFVFKSSSPNGHMALSASYIKVKGYWDKSLPNYKVNAVFNRELSWTTDTVSTNLLKHEQLHFDIAELYARKIRVAIDELGNNDINEDLPYNEIIIILLDSCDRIQDFYDMKTSHGVYIPIQDAWEKTISNELDNLSDYMVK